MYNGHRSAFIVHSPFFILIERLQKILSAQGIASRRKAEEYILQGLVKVNGKVAILGQKADPLVDTIEVSGKVLEDRQEMLYYLMNKPVGVVTENVSRSSLDRFSIGKPKEKAGSRNRTNDKRTNESTISVRDLLPPDLQGRVYPVGRLDKDSCGLLLFTNDGVLSYRLTHPKFEHEKEYEVTLGGPINAIAMRKLEEGFELDGSLTKPLKIHKIGPEMIRIVLTEGRNRQIRRMCQHVGYTVVALRRVRIMNIEDSRLRPGSIRALKEDEKKGLLRSVSL